MRAWGMVAVLAAAAALAGCAATARLDHYADRMTTYNKEAELAQDRAILLNVLRASRRRPLSFFELQSVSASGTPSGQLGFTIPLAQNGSTTAATAAPQFNLSSGPTVSANYIDTQEFYQGVLTPISLDTIDFFVQRGIPDTLLFNLFFQKAALRLHAEGKDAKAAAPIRTFVNNAGHDDALDSYQKLVATLLNNGLTTGAQEAEPADFGPPLTADAVADPAVLAKLAEAKLQLSSVAWCDLTPTERADIVRRGKTPMTDADACPAKGAAKGPATYADAGYFQVRKKGEDATHRLCFSAVAHAPQNQPRQNLGEGACETSGARRGVVTVRAISVCTLAAGLPEAFPAAAAAIAGGSCRPDETYDVEFTPRSTYGVIYYLGEVARRQLYPDDPAGNPKRVVMVRTAPATSQISLDPCPTQPAASSAGGDVCRSLFHLERAPATAHAFLTVDYEGQTYAVPDGDTHADLTNETLDIVSELIALNRSAKDAPASSLVTLVGAH